MKTRFSASALLLAALCSTGCALTEEVDEVDGAEGAEEAPAESVVESEAIVWCSNKAWRVDFYAEPALVNRVGWIQCQCWQPQTRSGTVSNYTHLAYEVTCSLD